MFKNPFSKLMKVVSAYKERKNEKAIWKEYISKHTCGNDNNIVNCNACCYASLKVGGFSDECIRLIISGDLIDTPKCWDDGKKITMSNGVPVVDYHV